MVSGGAIQISVALLLGSSSLRAQSLTVAAAPSTPRHPVTTAYHGVPVVDDYRWLENWDNPAVRAWSDSQNARARSYLDGLPSRSAILKQFTDLAGSGSVEYTVLQAVGGKLFAMKSDPAKQQPVLVTLASVNDLQSEKIIVDPNAMSATGAITIDFAAPSLDGAYVAVSLSENGTEAGAARVYEVSTGRELPDRIPRVYYATAAGSIAWRADASGFYYTRYPAPGERREKDLRLYQQVYFHKLRTAASHDRYVFGKALPRIAEIELRTDRPGHWLLASVKNGDGGEIEHYLRNGTGPWTQVDHFRDAVVSAQFGEDGYLYLLSRLGAPRGQVLRVLLTDPQLSKSELIIPETPLDSTRDDTRAAAVGVTLTADRLFLREINGGPSRVRLFDHAGRLLGVLPEPPVSAINTIVPLDNGDVVFPVETYLEPTAWYSWHSGSGGSERTALAPHSSINFTDAEVVREFVPSKDGTRVPINIIRKKGTVLDGSNPTLLYAYGGYGISETPYFFGARVRIWLDAGGVFVDANLRGGGEYGEEWHEGGSLTHKQNVFNDFIASAEYLIQHHYTSTSHLAALGVSNGGMLMGATVTQRPDLFRAVVSYVGIYDMLRFELEPNGQVNTTEFGTVHDPEQFKALYAYSPYHNVKDGARYPPILFLTGENDGRVNPFQSRKMVARLQAANASPTPILLRTSATSGHGGDASLDEQLTGFADVFAFLFDQLGVSYPPGASPHS